LFCVGKRFFELETRNSQQAVSGPLLFASQPSFFVLQNLQACFMIEMVVSSAFQRESKNRTEVCG
jgi:hypothetical protein